MPYIATRRLHDTFGKKVSRYLSYRKAKRMYNGINRSMMLFEARYLKSKMSHT
ncbi:MAG: hypothetical protein PHX20_06305 [Candidatus Omnitrophica bacterium]|nr:hypothetical protein [Candidatus Omnitrophota bacterium]MDD5437139.1 hypothetical protein [Candidatus Omnitrophota bacterium]